MSWTQRGALVAGLVALIPAGAGAAYGLQQTVGTYTTPAGATQVCQASCSSYTVSLPFTFSLYGKDYKSVSFSSSGLLAFEGGATATNAGIPSASTPNAFIAPWWASNNTSQGMSMRHAVAGEEPFRRMTFEWGGFFASGDSSFNNPDLNSMTVTLFEGSDKIEIRYFRDVNDRRNAYTRASMGIESWDGSEGVTLVGCSSDGSCEADDFPDGQLFRLTPGRDAAVDSFTVNNGASCTVASGALCAFAGSPSNITTRLRNLGGDSFTNASVDYYLSRDAKFSVAEDEYLGSSSASGTVAGSATGDVTGPATFPDWTPGQYWLIGVIGGVVGESDVGNNVHVNPIPLTLRSPGPNVVVASWMTVPPKLAHGKAAGNKLILELRNSGIQPVTEPALAVVLSANDFVSMQDATVFDGKLTGITLAPGETRQVTIDLDVPEGMPNDSTPGLGKPDDPYTLGVVIDPHDAASETNELDNAFVAPGKVTVGGGPLSIVSADLPDGGLGSPYGVQVLVSGGDGAISWQMSGAPGGLEVDDTGFLHGSPGQSGNFDVTFTVSDAKGGSTSRMLPLHVNSSELPLRVVTTDLPQAAFGVAYEAQLRAVGGCGPYTWTLQPATRLPPGLILTADGLIEGTPRQAGGNYNVDVTVADSCQNAEDLSTRLVISEPPKVTIAEIDLPVVTVGKNYTTNLLAAGGVVTDGYQWDVIQTVRLPLGPGDTQEYLPVGEAPPGLAVLADGTVTGIATEAGTYLMTVSVQDQAQPKRGTDEATIRVVVVYETGMSIITLTLPDAVASEPYSASITSSGGVGDLDWRILGSDDLPPGLQLDPASGRIVGTPEPTAIETGETESIWGFLVRVSDSQNRSAQQALAIRVMAKAPEQPEKVIKRTTGCSTSAGGLSAAGLLAAIALLRRRRR